MFNFSATIDPVTVLDQMKLTGVYDENTSRSYLLQLMEITPTAANVKEYIRIVKDKALLRRIAETAGSSPPWCRRGGRPPRPCWFAEQRSTPSARAAAPRAGAPVQNSGGRVRPAPGAVHVGLRGPRDATGFGDLDRTLTGFHGSELILLAARRAWAKPPLP